MRRGPEPRTFSRGPSIVLPSERLFFLSIHTFADRGGCVVRLWLSPRLFCLRQKHLQEEEGTTRKMGSGVGNNGVVYLFFFFCTYKKGKYFFFSFFGDPRPHLSCGSFPF